jgi:hypothetical protein
VARWIAGIGVLDHERVRGREGIVRERHRYAVQRFANDARQFHSARIARIDNHGRRVALRPCRSAKQEAYRQRQPASN